MLIILSYIFFKAFSLPSLRALPQCTTTPLKPSCVPISNSYCKHSNALSLNCSGDFDRLIRYMECMNTLRLLSFTYFLVLIISASSRLGLLQNLGDPVNSWVGFSLLEGLSS